MKLSFLNHERIDRNLRIKEVIDEGYGRTYEFDYHGNQVTDSRPNVLSLGRWTSPRGNDLMAGVNLNYLSGDQIAKLQQGLQPVLKSRNLKNRVGVLRRAFPDIFDTAYRTYNRDAVNAVDPGTLKFAAKPKMVAPDEDPTPGVPDEEPRFMDVRSKLGGDLVDKIRQRHEVDKPEEPTEPAPEEETPEEEPEVTGDMIGSDEVDVEEPTETETEVEAEEEDTEEDEEET